ncbi:MAG: KAP family P-loop NTPase fold protein [Bacteroidales bacterium]
MKTKEVVIEPEDPFFNCKLNRKEHAESLISIIDAYSDGFVLAVDGKWGTGKSTFVKMWHKALQNKGYKTIYFNAWESDFTSEPMLALLGELKSLDEINGTFNRVADKFKKLLYPLSKDVASKIGASELANAFLAEVNGYGAKKDVVNQFKNELTAYVKKNAGDKPLVFIVDELDRCRPDYAVEVLEKIKHIFSVDGVVFVLSIDKEQLGNSIRGYYGSDRIDADEYLRRFIDLNYNLPNPNYKEFLEYLFVKNGLDNRIGKHIISSQNMYEIFELFAKKYQLSLRQLEKMIVHFTVVIRSFNDKLSMVPCFTLILLKDLNHALYISLIDPGEDFSYIINELIDLFKEYLKREDSNYLNLCHNLAYLLVVCASSNKPQILNLSNYDLDRNEVKEVEAQYNLLINQRSPDLYTSLKDSIQMYTRKIDLLDNLKS